LNAAALFSVQGSSYTYILSIALFLRLIKKDNRRFAGCLFLTQSLFFDICTLQNSLKKKDVCVMYIYDLYIFINEFQKISKYSEK